MCIRELVIALHSDDFFDIFRPGCQVTTERWWCRRQGRSRDRRRDSFIAEESLYVCSVEAGTQVAIHPIQIETQWWPRRNRNSSRSNTRDVRTKTLLADECRQNRKDGADSEPRIGATLVEISCVCLDAEVPACTCDCSRIEVCDLEDDAGRRSRDAGCQSAHDTGDGHWNGSICYDECAWFEGAQHAVQCDNGLARQRRPHDDTMLLKAIVVKRMSRLSILFQTEIGHIDNPADRADAQLVKLSPESVTRWARGNILHQDTDVGTAQGLVVDCYSQVSVVPGVWKS